MKVLIATALWPTAENPAFGSFVHSQVLSLRRAGLEIEMLVLSGRYRKLIYPKGVLELRRRLADPSIGLVHAHYGYVGMVARTQVKVPVVVTYHGDDVLGTINARGERTGFSRAVAAAGRALGQFVDAVIVQSKQMADRFQRSNVYIIPHEVDLEVFYPEERNRARAILGLDPQKKYLLFASNPNIPVKRFPLAQAAADQLRNEDSSVEMVVIHKEPQPRLALYMSACDAMVFPSYQEGSPNIVKQAMACGLPIVATDVGDVREIIGRTNGCFVCNPRVDEFASRLRQILDLQQRTDGREHVRHLDGPSVAGQVIHVYEEALRRRTLSWSTVKQKVV
jgi:glycosyltransferase involved in cell wall biosynthesis